MCTVLQLLVFFLPAPVLFVFEVSILAYSVLTLMHAPKVFARLLLLYLLNGRKMTSIHPVLCKAWRPWTLTVGTELSRELTELDESSRAAVFRRWSVLDLLHQYELSELP